MSAMPMQIVIMDRNQNREQDPDRHKDRDRDKGKEKERIKISQKDRDTQRQREEAQAARIAMSSSVGNGPLIPSSSSMADLFSAPSRLPLTAADSADPTAELMKRTFGDFEEIKQKFNTNGRDHTSNRSEPNLLNGVGGTHRLPYDSPDDFDHLEAAERFKAKQALNKQLHKRPPQNHLNHKDPQQTDNSRGLPISSSQPALPVAAVAKSNGQMGTSSQKLAKVDGEDLHKRIKPKTQNEPADEINGLISSKNRKPAFAQQKNDKPAITREPVITSKADNSLADLPSTEDSRSLSTSSIRAPDSPVLDEGEIESIIREMREATSNLISPLNSPSSLSQQPVVSPARSVSPFAQEKFKHLGMDVSESEDEATSASSSDEDDGDSRRFLPPLPVSDAATVLPADMVKEPFQSEQLSMVKSVDEEKLAVHQEPHSSSPPRGWGLGAILEKAGIKPAAMPDRTGTSREPAKDPTPPTQEPKKADDLQERTENLKTPVPPVRARKSSKSSDKNKSPRARKASQSETTSTKSEEPAISPSKAVSKVPATSEPSVESLRALKSKLIKLKSRLKLGHLDRSQFTVNFALSLINRLPTPLANGVEKAKEAKEITKPVESPILEKEEKPSPENQRVGIKLRLPVGKRLPVPEVPVVNQQPEKLGDTNEVGKVVTKRRGSKGKADEKPSKSSAATPKTVEKYSDVGDSVAQDLSLKSSKPKEIKEGKKSEKLNKDEEAQDLSMKSTRRSQELETAKDLSKGSLKLSESAPSFASQAVDTKRARVRGIPQTMNGSTELLQQKVQKRSFEISSDSSDDELLEKPLKRQSREKDERPLEPATVENIPKSAPKRSSSVLDNILKNKHRKTEKVEKPVEVEKPLIEKIEKKVPVEAAKVNGIPAEVKKDEPIPKEAKKEKEQKKDKDKDQKKEKEIQTKKLVDSGKRSETLFASTDASKPKVNGKGKPSKEVINHGTPPGPPAVEPSPLPAAKPTAPPPPAKAPSPVPPSKESDNPEDKWNRILSGLSPLDTKLDFGHQRNLAKEIKAEADKLDRKDASNANLRSAMYLQSTVHFALMCRSVPDNKASVNVYQSTLDMLSQCRPTGKPSDATSLLIRVNRYLHWRAHAILSLKIYSINEERAIKFGRHYDQIRRNPSPAAATKPISSTQSSTNLSATAVISKSPSPSPGTTASPYSVGSTGSGSERITNANSLSQGNPSSSSQTGGGESFQVLSEYYNLSWPLTTSFMYWNRSKEALTQASEASPQVGQFEAWIQKKAPLTLDSSIEQMAQHLYVALWVLRAGPS